MTLLIAYKFILTFVFIFSVYPVYQGEVHYQVYGAGELGGELIDIILIVLFGGLISSFGTERRISKFIAFFQLIFVIIPALVLRTALAVPWGYFLILMGSFSIFLAFLKYMPTIEIRRPDYRIQQVGRFFLAISVFYVFAGLMAGGGLGRLNFDFSKVYEFRSDYVSSVYFGMGYLVNWVAYIILPYYTIDAYRRKKYGRIFIIILAHVFLFGTTSVKTFLFIPFIVIALVYFSEKYDIYKQLIIGAILLSIFLFIYYISGEIFGAAFLDRTFFVPAALHNIYYDFFAKEAYAYFSGSMLGKFLNSPYSDSSVYVIADHYWGRRFSPNVGWMADSYSNLGWVGVVVSAFFLAIILRVADAVVGVDRKPGWCEAMLIGPALALCSSAIGTTLLTHGLALFLFVVWIKPTSAVSLRPSLTGPEL